jgi:hypothetical protein
LGGEVETELALHIKKLQAAGFAPTRKTVQKLAFDVATHFGVKQNLVQRSNQLAVIGTDRSWSAILAFLSGKQKASLLLEPKV